MAKGQKRSTREVKKPKQKKEPAGAPAGVMKGISATATAPKKKG